MPSITLYYPRTKNLKNRAFKIETCERRKGLAREAEAGLAMRRALVDIERERVERRKGVQVVRVNFWF
jgi:hypothetical protein